MSDPNREDTGIDVQNAQITEILERVWELNFGQSITIDPEGTDVGSETFSLVGCISMGGSIKTNVVLECTRGLAREMAGSMFGMDPKEVSEEDINDAVGETVNVLAGEISELISSSFTPALPTVIESEDYTLHAPQGVLVARVIHQAKGEMLAVNVFAETANEE